MKPHALRQPANSTSASIYALLDECIAHGLVPAEFLPAGESDKEKRHSILARATVTWHQRYPDAPHDYVPRNQRLLWGGPEYSGPAELDRLPAGDAYEG